MTKNEAVPLSGFPASSIHFTSKSSLFGFPPRHQPFPRPRHLLPRKCRPDLLFLLFLHCIQLSQIIGLQHILFWRFFRFVFYRCAALCTESIILSDGSPAYRTGSCFFPDFFYPLLQFCDVGQGFLDLREEHLVFIILVVTVPF